jgi:hypothetical protein
MSVQTPAKRGRHWRIPCIVDGKFLTISGLPFLPIASVKYQSLLSFETSQ